MQYTDLALDTVGILIDAYYTDADIVSVLNIGIDTVRDIREDRGNNLEYAE